MKRGWGMLSFGHRLLLWDGYKCHLMETVKDVVDSQTQLNTTIIPGGLTRLVEPADVS